MGLCVSSNASVQAAAYSSSTAKVILPDGRLQEFCAGISVRASQALVNKEFSPPSAYFLCNADGLDIEGSVAAAALAEDDELEPGQIYFVLPSEMLKRRLSSEEMAKLAVRAAGAMTKLGGVVFAGVDPYAAAAGVGFEEKKLKYCQKTAPVARRRTGRSGGRSKGRDFTSDLAAILE